MRALPLVVAYYVFAPCRAAAAVVDTAQCPSSGDVDAQDDEMSFLQTLRASRGVQVGEGEGAGTCIIALSEKCSRLRPCSNNRGPTECCHEKGVCVCQPGFCSDGKGSCVSAAKTVRATILPVNGGPKDKFPPRQQNVRTGIAVSGGGPRSLSFAVGVLRGLLQQGFLENTDLITGVSGGAWTVAPLVYADRSYEQLLGTPTPPGTLSLAVLGEKNSEIGATMNTSSTPIGLALLALKTPLHEIWSRTLGEMVLAPFGLNGPGIYTAETVEDVKRIQRENPKLAAARFVTPQAGRPEVITMSTLLSPRGTRSNNESAVQLQVSPGYIGSPYYPDGRRVKYSCLKDEDNEDNLVRLVGGGFVEAFAFNGDGPKSCKGQMGGCAVEISAPPVPFSLADAIGSSSWEPGAEFGQTIRGIINPRARYWPVTSKELPGPTKSSEYKLGDGGNMDNTGLLTLLQREPSEAILIMSAFQGLNMSYPWEQVCDAGNPANFDPIAAGVVDSFISLFGFGPQVTTDGFFYLHNQIYEKDSLFPLSCTIWTFVVGGVPAVVQVELPIMENTYWGISPRPAGDFRLIVMYLAPSTEFVDLLPQDTQDEIALGDAGEFRNFPYFGTTNFNGDDLIAYTLPQINLLSGLGEYYVEMSSEFFETQ